jgi:hypothetical protein
MFQLHLGAAGLVVSCSELSTEKLGHKIAQVQSARSYPEWKLDEKTQLHERFIKFGVCQIHWNQAQIIFPTGSSAMDP